ncbi:MAG: biopolymer transporter ExbD [Kiritimatiellia bacterium]|jgi:biopolymer transport protein ExbD|nr:biopolymer transporter ExbD [Kiritimatiellia bacterium]MDP6631107.1 biopolymer transporter ExbD [Kiritimatiellia bacterium]MDP6810064.1 biopolymer transporter ExbD [Kiritimatiellia bacterium]MDP7024835.1 biopolymer transporter ExbD [Kiritimatiellia bacterium]
MTVDRDRATWSIKGLRTRYAPKSRLGHGMISIAPWLDFVLLLLLFGLLNSNLVLQPGVVVSLPDAPFRQGTGMDMVAVVLSVPDTESGRSEVIVFFDDERFMLGKEEQINAFAQALAEHRKDHPDAPLVLQADKGIPQGSIMEIVNIASGVGVKKVNLAIRPR